MSKSKYFAVLSSAALSASLFMFCGNGGGSAPASSGQYGSIEIRARVVNQALAKSSGTQATVADRVVLEIGGEDGGEPTRIERRIDLSRPTLTDTVTRVPVGRNQRIVVFAIDRDGATTHIDSTESHTLTIENAVVAQLFATLIPAAGSIYLQFAGLGTDVSAVYASFTADDGTLVAENRVARAARTFMSVDNIPHLTAGVLKVAMLNSHGDTLFISHKELTFNARANNSIDLQFMEYTGMIGVDVAIYIPGVTTGSYDFGSKESSVVETGELIITEIMWNASNDNYIELYNPADETVFFDVLTTDIDGTKRSFEDVTVAPRGYLVIGRQEAPYIKIYTPTTSGLPITSTGNWITVRRGDGSVVDRVICPGSNTATGWPAVSGRRSIELSRDKYNAEDNNYGKNWNVTEGELIEGTTIYGTPGW